MLGFGDDLFGNATNISDQIDPYYRAPGADPERPNAGFQFTPEMAVSIGILEVRNFGLESFDEPARLAELQALIAKHGDAAGAQIWDDLNFLNDPLAPVTVPDPTTPGYGGPLALRIGADPRRAWRMPRRASRASTTPPRSNAAAPRRRGASEFASRSAPGRSSAATPGRSARQPLGDRLSVARRLPADRHPDAVDHALRREPQRRGRSPASAWSSPARRSS